MARHHGNYHHVSDNNYGGVCLQHPGLVQTDRGAGITPYTGGFSYSYPIEVPKGLGNTTPQILLNYSSTAMDQGGGDYTSGKARMGRGWSLSGLMSIEKGGNDYYLVANGATYKLILGADGYYHAESENFARIKKESNYWTVTTKDGSKYELGSTLDSRHWNGADYAWEENKLTDIYNNTRTVAYTESTFLSNPTRLDIITFPKLISYNNITIELQVDNKDLWRDAATSSGYHNSVKFTDIIVRANAALVHKVQACL